MPTSYNTDLAAIGASAIEEMTSRNRAREEALSISRQVIRHSANAIRAVHRGQFEEAQSLIHQAGERLEETKPMRQESPQIYYAGFLADARKEYSEASITLAVISANVIPKPEDLEVDPSSFLNGLAEVIGEYDGLAIRSATFLALRLSEGATSLTVRALKRRTRVRRTRTIP